MRAWLKANAWALVQILVMGLIALVLSLHFSSQTSEIKSSDRTACLNGGQSRIGQLHIDWVIYAADHTIATIPPLTASTRTRGVEADQILAGMQAIAAVRIDKRLAYLLPAPLAATVRRVDFTCQ
jgi:hypothetical protein